MYKLPIYSTTNCKKRNQVRPNIINIKSVPLCRHFNTTHCQTLLLNKQLINRTLKNSHFKDKIMVFFVISECVTDVTVTTSDRPP